MTIAATILAQLGSNRFIAMTGAKNLVAGNDTLSFDLPRGTLNKASRCTIKLAGNDTYVIAFYKWFPKSLEMRPVGQPINGVQVANLRETFTRATGLAVSL